MHWLLEQGAAANRPDIRGFTPLFNFVEAGPWGTVQSRRVQLLWIVCELSVNVL